MVFELSSYLWLIKILACVFVLILVQAGVMKMFKKLQGRNAKHVHDWRHELDVIVRPPLAFILWVLGIIYVMDVMSQHLEVPLIPEYLAPIRKAAIVGALAWLLFRWKEEYQDSLLASKKGHHEITTIQLVGRVGTILIVLVAGIILLQIFGLNTTPLVAFGSVGAAAIGFASKDVIANFCSGMMVFISQPFLVGDWITLPEHSIEGTIEEIGWFRTVVRSRDKRPIYVPNSYFSTAVVINGSRLTYRHFKHTIHLEFKDGGKIPELAQKVKKALAAHPKIAHDQPIFVNFLTYGENGCDLAVEAFSNEKDQERFNMVQQELLMEIHEAMTSLDMETASLTVSLKQSP